MARWLFNYGSSCRRFHLSGWVNKCLVVTQRVNLFHLRRGVLGFSDTLSPRYFES